MPNSLLFIAVLSLIAGIILSGFLYFRQGKNYTKAVLYSLFGLRALAFALLLFVLIAPFINYKTKEIKQPIVAVLVDNSASMVLGEDSAQVKSALLKTVRESLDGLEDAQAQFYQFDDALEEGEADFQGSATDIANALDNVVLQTDRERLAAVVLVSDGIVNRGSNPLYKVEESFLPVFTIAVGDSAQQKDFAIAQIRAPEYVFRGDDIKVDITVSADNLEGLKSEVVLFLKNKRIAAKPVNVTSNAFAKVYSFELNASSAGLFTYTVSVEKQAEERNVSNNQRQFTIEVIENRKKIAVVASSPSPDVAAVREALKKVDAYEVGFVNSNTSGPLTEETELAIVFLQPFADAAALQNVISKYNGPLWLMVDPEADAQLFQGQMAWMSKVGRPQGIEAKVNFNKNFGLFKLSKESTAAFSKMPTLNIFTGSIRAAGSFENLVTDSQGKAIAAYGSVESRKVVLFNLNGLWHWRMADYQQNQTHNHIDEWLQVTAQYLTAGNNGNRLRLNYEKRIAVGNDLKIFAEVYDATFTETNEAKVDLALQNEVGETFNYSLSNDGTGYQASLNALKQGEYRFTVSAQLGAENLKATGAFYVEGTSLEQLNTRANFTLLAQMAEASEGKFYTLNTIGALATDINSHPKLKPVESVKTKSLALIDLKFIFVLMIILFGAEWFLRRYFGKI